MPGRVRLATQSIYCAFYAYTTTTWNIHKTNADNLSSQKKAVSRLLIISSLLSRFIANTSVELQTRQYTHPHTHTHAHTHPNQTHTHTHAKLGRSTKIYYTNGMYFTNRRTSTQAESNDVYMPGWRHVTYQHFDPTIGQLLGMHYLDDTWHLSWISMKVANINIPPAWR